MTILVPASYKSDVILWHINCNWCGLLYYQMSWSWCMHHSHKFQDSKI